MLAATNKIWLNTHAHFELQIFITILVCGYLLAYKITNYLTEFKTLKNKSRIEIIFLTLFFTILFIPMMHIDKSLCSNFDSRELEKFHPLIENNQLNNKFGVQFDKWFSDRFLTRKAVIKARKDVLDFISLNGSNSAGKYFTNGNFIYAPFETKIIDIKKGQESLKTLEKFDKFCEQNGIKLYVLITPVKTAIYPMSWVKYNDKEFNEIVKYERENNHLKVIFPADELKKESEYVYFKTEHHWTDSGAFVGYKEIMKLIKKDFPNVKVLDENDFDYFYNKKVRGDFSREFHTGNTCRTYKIPYRICKKYSNTDYKYFRHKDFETLETKVIEDEMHREKFFYYPKGADLRVIMLGTSMNENLTEFIPFTFKHVYRLRTNSIPENKIMKYLEKKMLDYKPDIIIFCLLVDHLYGITEMFNME